MTLQHVQKTHGIHVSDHFALQTLKIPTKTSYKMCRPGMEPSNHPGRSVLGNHNWSCCSFLPYFLVLRVPLGAGKFFLTGA